MADLSSLEDDALSEEVRRREVAFQEGLAEVAARVVAIGDQRNEPRTERQIAAALARKRANDKFDIGEPAPDELAPPLFKMGYEWCALDFIRILDDILKTPSSEIDSFEHLEPAGRGLWRGTGKRFVSDPRRKAALDLITRLEGYVRDRLKWHWFISRPPRGLTDTQIDLDAAEVASAFSGKLFEVNHD